MMIEKFVREGSTARDAFGCDEGGMVCVQGVLCVQGVCVCAGRS